MGMVSVLIAEDDAYYRKYLEKSLLSAGFTARSCQDGLEAYHAFSSDPESYRILLVDLLMPNMDGFELIRQVRTNFKHLYPYIFVVTSLGDDEDVVRALQVGADEVLIKPISPKRLVASVTSGLQKLKLITFDVLMDSFVEMLDMRDRYTGRHSKNVQLLASLLAKLYAEQEDLTNVDFINGLSAGAVLHDIGKILIPEYILQKPDRLTSEEFETVKKHTIFGSQILVQSLMKHPENDVLKFAHEVIRSHHERWDGKGYPDGLKETEIPLVARIVKIADVFDALTSDRYYRKAYSPEDALKIMESDADAFDPEIFALFLEHRKFFMALERRKYEEARKTKDVSS